MATPSNTYENVRQLLQRQQPQPSLKQPAPPAKEPSTLPLTPDVDLYSALMALNPAAMLFSNLAMLQQQMQPQLVSANVDPMQILNRNRKRPANSLDEGDCGSRGGSGGGSPSSSSSDDVVERKTKRKAAFDAWHHKKLMQLQSDDSHGIADSTTNTSDSLRDQLTNTHSPSLSSLIRNPPAISASNSGKQQHRDQVASSTAKELTAPKLSRHNDAAYYPNIQCILCNEWVCSRNRYMHIESHLQYRPYKCSLCGYDNRKEIFIQLHIKRTHKGAGQILYLPDADLEHRAWQLAEQCLQHTRQILVNKCSDGSADSAEDATNNSADPQTAEENADKAVACGGNKKAVDEKLLVPYGTVYRPKIFNSQRAEKSQLIEESRQMGLVPDFSEVASREEECGVCGSHILRHQSVLEEHVRTHVSQPAYRCGIDGCGLEHHAKNFINRHMKEVHKYRRAPEDLLEQSEALLTEFLELCHRCFATFFTADALTRVRYRCTQGALDKGMADGQPKVEPKLEQTSATRSILREQLAKPVTLSMANATGNNNCAMWENFDSSCQLCCVDFQGAYSVLYEHIKTHLSQPPFLCKLCPYTSTNLHTLNTHVRFNHADTCADKAAAGAHVTNKFTAQVARQCKLLMNACFPDVTVQTNKHDLVVQ